MPQSFERLKVSVAVVLPYSVFKKKSYTKKIIQVGFPKESQSMIEQPKALFHLRRRML